MKKMTLEEVKDKYIGAKGTPARERYERKLLNDLNEEKTPSKSTSE